MENKKNVIFILIVCFCFSCVENKKTLNNIEFVNDYKNWYKNESRALADSVILDFSQLSKFTWDKVYVFKPYTSIDELIGVINIQWDSAGETLINQSDDFNLLVFIEKNEVKYYAKIPRNFGDFMKLKTNGPFYYNNSKFVMKEEKYGHQKWFMIYEFPN